MLFRRRLNDLPRRSFTGVGELHGLFIILPWARMAGDVIFRNDTSVDYKVAMKAVVILSGNSLFGFSAAPRLSTMPGEFMTASALRVL